MASSPDLSPLRKVKERKRNELKTLPPLKKTLPLDLYYRGEKRMQAERRPPPSPIPLCLLKRKEKGRAILR